MDEKLFAPPTGKVAGRPQMRRDQLLASVLRRLHSQLQPSTCSVYLLTADGHELAASMAVATPLSFTVTRRVAADDPHFPAPRALRTGESVIFEGSDIQNLARRFPALLPDGAYPMSIVVVPVRTPRHRFGVLSLRWAPPREVPEHELEHLRTVADELAADLEGLAEEGVSVEAPFVPLFISESSEFPGALLREAPTSKALSHRQEELAVGPHAGITYLYRLQKLTSDLSAAVCTRDVVATVQTHLVRRSAAVG
jgi:hypothetical protein